MKKRDCRMLGIRNCRGQITVMLSLLLSIILLFLLTVTEGVHIYLGKGRATRNLIASSESVMADYDPFLWNRFRILAVDETYGSENKQALNYKLQEYFLNQQGECEQEVDMGLFGYEMDQLLIRKQMYFKDDVQYLKNEVRELMKYEEPEKLARELYKRYCSAVNNSETENAKQEVTKAEQESKKSEQEASKSNKNLEKKKRDDFPENDKGEKDNKKQNTSNSQKDNGNSNEQTDEQEDPRKNLKKILNSGVVELVTGNMEISKENLHLDEFQILNNGSKGDTITDNEQAFAEKKDIFQEAKDVTDLLPKQSESSFSNEMLSKTLSVEYVSEYFRCYIDDAQESVKNQMEYIIAGKDTDYDNLKNIINRLLLLRFPIDYIYAVKSTELRTEAETVATALTAATPALQTLVTLLLLACVSYAEAILDVRTLLYEQGTIPVYPTKESWQLSLSNMGKKLITSKVKSGNKKKQGILHEDEKTTMFSKKEMGYKDYLKVLLFLSWNDQKQYERMMQVMNVLGKQQNDRFNMNEMLFGFQVDMKVRFFPKYVSVLDGNFQKQGIHFQFQKIISY